MAAFRHMEGDALLFRIVRVRDGDAKARGQAQSLNPRE